MISNGILSLVNYTTEKHFVFLLQNADQFQKPEQSAA